MQSMSGEVVSELRELAEREDDGRGRNRPPRSRSTRAHRPTSGERTTRELAPLVPIVPTATADPARTPRRHRQSRKPPHASSPLPPLRRTKPQPRTACCDEQEPPEAPRTIGPPFDTRRPALPSSRAAKADPRLLSPEKEDSPRRHREGDPL